MNFRLHWILKHLVLLNLLSSIWASPPITKIMDDLFLGYDKRIRPHYGEKPLEVSATAHIISLTNVDEVNMDFTTSIFFRQMWNDPRLKYDESRQNVSQIIFRPESTLKMWSPDTFIMNEVKSYINVVTAPNEVILISPLGEILKSIRSDGITITATCPMQLHDFPFNTLDCNLEFESYGYKTNEIFFTWKDGMKSASISSGAVTQSYELISAVTLSQQIHLVSGNYSRLTIKMQLRRLWGRYVLTTFLPTLLLVFLSLLSLWIANMKISTIVSFLNIGILIIFLTVHNTSSDLPKVSYLTALDIHMLMCISIIAVIALVNVTTLYFVKKAARLSTYKMKNISIPPKPTVPDAEEVENLCKGDEYSSKEEAKRSLDEKLTEISLDVLFNLKWLFLVLFTIFQTSYWTYFLN